MGKDQRSKKHGLDVRRNRKLKQQQAAPPPPGPRRGKGKR